MDKKKIHGKYKKTITLTLCVPFSHDIHGRGFQRASWAQTLLLDVANEAVCLEKQIGGLYQPIASEI